MKSPYPLLIVFFLIQFSHAQDIAKIGKEKALSIGGGFSFNQIFSFNQQSGRDPYSYVATGNLNLSLYGWSVPLSFSFSNEELTYQQPFNQYAVHPTYKWFTGHLGYTSVNFSPYTVNGHLFLGGAADVKTEDWSITSFYGRLLRKTIIDSARNLPGSYERWGYGFKSGYNTDGTSVSVSFFTAHDKIDTYSQELLANNVFPQKNIALGADVSQRIFKNIQLTSEWGGSLITNNLFSPLQDSSQSGSLIDQRTSTAFYQALKTSIVFQKEKYSIGGVYEWVAPGYKTLGAYYFNNDIENISLMGSLSVIKEKVMISANSGIQRDNLDGEKASEMKRWVNAYNILYAATERLNIQGNYSNFSTFTNIHSQFVNINQTTPYSNLDTLSFTQLSESAGLNVNYRLGDATTSIQNLMVSSNFQKASEKQDDVTKVNAGSSFYNSLVTYTLGLQEKKLIYSFSINYSQISSFDQDTRIFGPVVSMSKTLFSDKCKLNGAAAWNRTSGLSSSDIITVRLNASYVVAGAHQLQLSAVQQKRIASETPTASDTNVMLSYNYNF